jgi:sulfide dehydrogenase cytochrome subunit
MKIHTLALALYFGSGLGAVAGIAHAQPSTPASGQGPTTQQMLYVKSLAATCATCHGTNGQAIEGSQMVSLAGLDKNDLIAKMTAFKAGTRPATVMHQISKGYSNAQIETIASYFVAQKK